VLLLPATQVPFGLSCKTHIPSATDTWQSIASKYKVLVSELIRANPQATGRVTGNTPVFIPPCIDGVLQGTKTSGARAASLMAVDQRLPLKQAGATAKAMDADALVAEAAAAQAAAAAAAAAEPAAAAEGN
jgi:hypothetical protein